jgi:alkanesulfonate monooxygenase SsuD/methylene tetrahydromethanopterin reductase-like flavin-dependent oxidoreductase (luciferase family)
MKFGALLWPQQAHWTDIAAAAAAADESGWDSIWTWDHLLSVRGGPDRPIFEGWTTIAAIAATTKSSQVGLMVAANTLRNPGLTAKLAVTLDHISGGRAVLGIGSGWLEPEHMVHGIPYGASPGERLDQLEEAIGIIRPLIDGEQVTASGRFYDINEARHFPRSMQERMPLLIGGAGPRKTLRIVAEHADMWNTNGSPDKLAALDAVLREHCERVGRDPESIERTCGVSIVIREDAEAARAVLEGLVTPFGIGIDALWPPLLGSPRQVAEGLVPFHDAGFDHVIVALQPPYDQETLERIDEVRHHVDELLALR